MAQWRKTRAGQWQPCIPAPVKKLKKICVCGKKFWTVKKYRDHYFVQHIVFGPYYITADVRNDFL